MHNHLTILPTPALILHLLTLLPARTNHLQMTSLLPERGLRLGGQPAREFAQRLVVDGLLVGLGLGDLGDLSLGVGDFRRGRFGAGFEGSLGHGCGL